jgi:predicted transcriptional regulator
MGRNGAGGSCPAVSGWLHAFWLLLRGFSASHVQIPVGIRDENAMNDNNTSGFIELTADIVSAYVSNNSVAAGDIPNLIGQIHSALLRVSAGQSDLQPEPLKPAVSLKKSITPDYLVCLEDGKKFKSLKRHLRTQYNMTPEQYRDKWNLAPDYPMVAPNYAAARSQLAKQMGLGQQRRRRSK